MYKYKCNNLIFLNRLRSRWFKINFSHVSGEIIKLNIQIKNILLNIKEKPQNTTV